MAIGDKEKHIIDNLMALEERGSAPVAKADLKAQIEEPLALKDYFASPKQEEKARQFQLAALEKGEPSKTLSSQAAPVLGKLEQTLSKKEEYQQADPIAKIEMAQEELKASKSKNMSAGEIFARSLIALAPALIGKALGGSIGGAAGAEASVKALSSMDEAQKLAREAEQKDLESQIKTQIDLMKYRREAEKAAVEQGQKARELQLKERGVQIQELEAMKKAAPGATKLPPDKVIAISEFKAIPQLLADLNTSIEQNETLFGRGAGRVAGAMTKVYPLDVVDTLEAQISNVRQTVGKLKEGGVLRAEDEVKYRKMLPELTDSPEVAKNKIKLVLREMNQKYLNTVGALQSAGYDVSPFTAEPIEVPALPSAGPSAKIKLPGQTPEAMAAPAKPDFSRMSDQELLKYLGQ